MLASVPSVVGGEEDVGLGEHTTVYEPAHDTRHEVVERLQSFGRFSARLSIFAFLASLSLGSFLIQGGLSATFLSLKDGRRLASRPSTYACRAVLVYTGCEGPWAPRRRRRLPRLRGGADEGLCAVRYHVRFVVCGGRAEADVLCHRRSSCSCSNGRRPCAQPSIPARRFTRGAGVSIEYLPKRPVL